MGMGGMGGGMYGGGGYGGGYGGMGGVSFDVCPSPVSNSSTILE